ncbi:hypothetical protein TNCV_3190311 [Trichonephila clavipes]|nr:hypothetical protein TNCV_3190311 [Trichonephila clavipes]
MPQTPQVKAPSPKGETITNKKNILRILNLAILSFMQALSKDSTLPPSNASEFLKAQEKNNTKSEPRKNKDTSTTPTSEFNFVAALAEMQYIFPKAINALHASSQVSNDADILPS